QAAPVLHEQLEPGPVQDADPRPRMGLRLPRRHRHRRVVRVGAAPQGRHQGAQADPHPARCGIRAAASVFLGVGSAMTAEGSGQRAARPWEALRDLSDRTSLRTKLITGLLALVIVAIAAISISGVWVLRSYLTSQDDSQLRSIYTSALSQGVSL